MKKKLAPIPIPKLDFGFGNTLSRTIIYECNIWGWIVFLYVTLKRYCCAHFWRKCVLFEIFGPLLGVMAIQLWSIYWLIPLMHVWTNVSPIPLIHPWKGLYVLGLHMMKKQNFANYLRNVIHQIWIRNLFRRTGTI